MQHLKLRVRMTFIVCKLCLQLTPSLPRRRTRRGSAGDPTASVNGTGDSTTSPYSSDLAADAYSRVTGVTPSSQFKPSRQSAQFAMLKQSEFDKQEQLMQQSKGGRSLYFNYVCNNYESFSQTRSAFILSSSIKSEYIIECFQLSYIIILMKFIGFLNIYFKVFVPKHYLIC